MWLSWLRGNKIKPVPGEDAHWIALCRGCNEFDSFASRGGFKNGGVEHCYGCGLERESKGYKEEDIKRMVISSWCHWKKFPLIPYNWHELTEEEKWKILGLNCT
jgi:hypothetical protein